jgi:hypothetical protein
LCMALKFEKYVYTCIYHSLIVAGVKKGPRPMLLLQQSRIEKAPRRRGILVIASAYRTEYPGFESHQGVRFLGIYTLQCGCHNLICIVIVCTGEKINQ